MNGLFIYFSVLEQKYSKRNQQPRPKGRGMLVAKMNHRGC